MVMTAFLYFLSNKLKSGVGWLKAYFKDKDGITGEASPGSISRIGEIHSEGDVNIYNNTINLVVDKNSPDFSKSEFNEMFQKISLDISGHSGIAIDTDNGITVARQTSLDQRQMRQIKIFKEAGWEKDKLRSIRIAYKIINLEDSGSFEKANQLMESAFNGTKRQQNRKFYNLARSGYLEGFAFDMMMSASLRSDQAITKILEDFPEALFLDHDFSTNDMILELETRSSKDTKRVSVFARGLKRIELMELGYNNYLGWEIQKNYNSKDSIRLYTIESKTQYKIGGSESERIDLLLRDIIIDDNRNRYF